MITLKILNEQGATCNVFFDDSASLYDPSEPLFSDPTFRFPYDSIPDQYGHMPNKERTESPHTFRFKAEMFGYVVEVTDAG